MKKLHKILESCYLCLRFPFLYPRNRWTGRHKVNILHSVLWKLYQKSVDEISITARLCDDDKDCAIYSFHPEHSVALLKADQLLYLSNSIDSVKVNLYNLLWSSKDKFTILGFKVSKTYANNICVTICVKPTDESDMTNYGFHYEMAKLVKNRFIYFIYTCLKWIDLEILDRLLFIPTYTELDAMPVGWRKAFGIQMCQDIRTQLKKDHCLYQYRIVQIKEKFGTLRWYDECSSKAIQDIIQKYEDLSWNTCINCGKPSTKITNGWISPYCDECFPKNHFASQVKINNTWVYAENKEKV